MRLDSLGSNTGAREKSMDLPWVATTRRAAFDKNAHSTLCPVPRVNAANCIQAK
jgi:hypothetical protein